jgi:murein DD-endopeptidase MepM/ murein hydrolase activator NlpD
MSRTAVSAGQTVKKGQVIGFEGSTGRATGAHCHYEVMINGNAVNPMTYLN